MQKVITIKLLPSEAADEQSVKKYIANAEAVKISNIYGYNILKQSIDGRGRQAWINLTLQAFINEPYHARQILSFSFKDVTRAEKRVVIIGAGPASLFSALKLIEAGIKQFKCGK